MPKHRVFQLAKDFGTSSKVVIDIFERNNIPVKNHMSTVDENARQLLVKLFDNKKSLESNKKTSPSVVEKKEGVKELNVDVKKTKSTQKESVLYKKKEQTQQIKKEPFKPKQHVVSKDSTQQKPFTHNKGRNEKIEKDASLNTVKEVRPQQGAQHKPRVPFVPNRNKKVQHTKPVQKSDTGNQVKKNIFTPSKPKAYEEKPFVKKTFSSAPKTEEKKSTVPTSKFIPRNKSKLSDKKYNKRDKVEKQAPKVPNKPPKAGAFIMPTVSNEKPTSVELPESVSVKDFSALLKRAPADVIKRLMLLGVMANINQEIDFDTASLVASDFNVEVLEKEPEQDPTEMPEIIEDPKKQTPRPPVVTIMGHVDHGKTSLLDTIRKTNITAREAGGITQHIGAYQVNYQGKKIVFLDTPGHEAFTSMRARGAQVTDIAILVVAADDGVMPQTIEAINHAKAANVPIIVAINKIDKPAANPEKIKQQLAEHGLQSEDWGGETITVPVSAHQKTGISELLEMVLLVSEMQELKADPTMLAQGTIIEAQLDKNRGPVATVLVQKGTLRIGETIIAGTAFGKVRAMTNERGEQLKKAGPSTPVELLGLSDVPMAGDILYATDEKTARNLSEKRVAKRKVDELQQSSKVSLDDIFKQIQEGKLKELNIVVKADVQGTIEALIQSLEGIKNDEVKVVVVHSGVGAIKESDVMLASAANALIIGFNVRPDSNARKIAETETVDIRTYRVIYDAINDVELAIKGMLAPKYKETIQGRVEIRQIITISKMIIAGCYVTEGKITRSSKVRLLRDNVVIYEGELESLRRFKDDVREVAAGYECGITIEKFRDVKEGDVIEAYVMEEIKQ